MKSPTTIAALAGAVSVIASTVGLSAGIAPAAASPAQSGATLYVNEDPGGPGRGGTIYHLDADDGNGFPGDQDLSYGFFPGTQTDGERYLRATPAGIEYLREISIPKEEARGWHHANGSVGAPAQHRSK